MIAAPPSRSLPPQEGGGPIRREEQRAKDRSSKSSPHFLPSLKSRGSKEIISDQRAPFNILLLLSPLPGRCNNVSSSVSSSSSSSSSIFLCEQHYDSCLPRGFRGLDGESRATAAAKEEKKERRRLFADEKERERPSAASASEARATMASLPNRHRAPPPA